MVSKCAVARYDLLLVRRTIRCAIESEGRR